MRASASARAFSPLSLAAALRLFGGGGSLPPRWRGRAEQARRLLAILAASYGAHRSAEVFVGFVPGRVEVLGRHTDYAGGRSLVCAIERGFLFTAAAGRGSAVRMREDSTEFGETCFELSASLRPEPGAWTSYPVTMARRLAANFGADRPLAGADIAFSSTLPVGSGMSGSSALMMMTFTALAGVNRLEAHPAFRASIGRPVDLAGYLACAENGQSFRSLAGDSGVGTFGGSEDHAAILCGRPETLSLFRFSPMELEEEIRWPARWRLALAFSGVRAEKTREALEKYNLASRRARAAVEAYNARHGTRFGTVGEALRAGARPGDWLDLEGGPVPGLADRVRQFAAEERRIIPGALRAVRASDLHGFGRQLTASHRASARWLWNIVPEVERLAATARSIGALGASGFGAGFGGSALALITSSEAPAFPARWRDPYLARFPGRSEADFFIARPGPGIEVWTGAGPVRLVDRIFTA